MNNKYCKYAIVDLHLHLDGSLSPEIIIEIAQQEHLELPTFNPAELRNYLEVPKNCDSLNEYLKRFDLPNIVLQSKNGIYLATYDLLRRLSVQGLLYAEIRMAPQLSTAKGLSQQEVINALREACLQAENKEGIKSRIILCLMRGPKNHKANMETIAIADANKDIVAACDLAGAEALFPNELFDEEFKLIKKLGLKLTIHSGEAAGPESVWSALKYNPDRIGHGVHSVQDPLLVEELAKRHIPLELCPTSNVDTKAIAKIEDMPIKKMLSKGVVVTINTDDMTVSNTTLSNEYSLLETIGISEKEAQEIALNSIDAAFLPERDKKELKKVLKARSN